MSIWKEFLDHYNKGLVSLKDMERNLEGSKIIYLGNLRYMSSKIYLSAYETCLLNNVVKLCNDELFYNDYYNDFNKTFDIWLKHIKLHSTLLFDQFDVEIPKVKLFYKEGAVKVDIIKSRTAKHSNRSN